MRRVSEAQQRYSDLAKNAIVTPYTEPQRSLTLEEVARITNLPADVILQWEAEKLFTSQRQRNGQQRYNDKAIQRIFTIHRLVQRQVPLSHVRLFMEELAQQESRNAVPLVDPLATTQRFLTVLRQVDAAIFTQLYALGRDLQGTPEGVAQMLQREVATLQPTFGAHHLLFWLRQSADGAWFTDMSGMSASQQRRLTQHANKAVAQGKVSAHAYDKGRSVTIAPCSLDAEHQGVLMVIRDAKQPLDKSECAALEYIAQRLMSFYFATCCWLRDRQEARFDRMLLNVLPQPLIIRDDGGKVVFFNESAEAIAQNVQMIRAARDNQLPLPTPVWESATPDGAPLDTEHAPSMRAIREGEVIRDMQMRITPPTEDGDPQSVPAMATSVPLFTEDGQAAYSVTIVQDMTTPAQIQELKDNLIDRVQHQIHNGLTTIKGYSQIIESLCQRALIEGEPTFDAVLLEKMRNYAHIVSQQTRSIGKWTFELHDIDNYAMGKPIACSLMQQVRECIDEMRASHPDYHFAYEAEAGDASLEGRWVPSDINFIITNLLENAVKYSAPHSSINVFLRRMISEDKPIAQMLVRDEGMGIPASEYGRIFENGTRLGQDDADGNPIPGTGKGLYLCRIYTMRYKGKIFPRANKTGPGTEFVVKLPLLH